MKNSMSYVPGEIVNGHRLNESGTEWIPVETSPATPPAPPSKQGWSTGKKVLVGVGAGFTSLVIVGALAGGGDSGTEVGPPSGEPAAVQEPAAVEQVEAAPVAPEEEAATDSVLPADQVAFGEQVERSRDEIANAETDLQEAAALRARDEALVGIIGSDLRVENWVGTVTDVGANGEGKAYVEIEIAPDVRVKTWNNAFSDISDNTLIPSSDPIYDTLLQVTPGTEVTFSGKFFPGSDTALYGTNLTEVFYGIDPQFLFDFTAISIK